MLELLLVITIIAVLSAIAYPRLTKAVRSAGVKDAAEQMAEMVRFARAEAIRHELRTRIKVSEDGTSYRLELQDREAGNQDVFTGFGEDFFDNDRLLPSGVRVDRMLDSGQVLGTRVIVFTPDGISPAYKIHLTGNDGQKAFVEIGAWFDQVTVSFPVQGANETKAL